MYGLGQTAVLNCPGDPGCPGYVAPGSADYQTSLLQEILANQSAGGVVAPAAAVAPVSASWVSGIPNSYVLIGAGILGVLLLVKRR